MSTNLPYVAHSCGELKPSMVPNFIRNSKLPETFKCHDFLPEMVTDIGSQKDSDPALCSLPRISEVLECPLSRRQRILMPAYESRTELPPSIAAVRLESPPNSYTGDKRKFTEMGASDMTRIKMASEPGSFFPNCFSFQNQSGEMIPDIILPNRAPEILNTPFWRPASSSSISQLPLGIERKMPQEDKYYLLKDIHPLGVQHTAGYEDMWGQRPNNPFSNGFFQRSNPEDDIDLIESVTLQPHQVFTAHKQPNMELKENESSNHGSHHCSTLTKHISCDLKTKKLTRNCSYPQPLETQNSFLDNPYYKTDYRSNQSNTRSPISLNTTFKSGKQRTRDQNKLARQVWLLQNRMMEDILDKTGFKVLVGNNGSRICSLCHKEFAKAMFVWRHAFIHVTKKPFYCTTCNKAFTRSDTLQRHIRRFSHSS